VEISVADYATTCEACIR